MTLANRVAVFNQGEMQQVGPPLELYHRPANRFVACFLGSPSMNILPVRREGAVLRGQGFSVPVPEDLGDASSDRLLVGVRPQELLICRDGMMSGEVEAIERLGFDGYAFLSTPAGKVAARFSRDASVCVGDKVGAEPVGDAMHVFLEDGRALRHPRLSSH